MEKEYYITFLYEGTFFIQNWKMYQSLATIYGYSAPIFSELAQVLKSHSAKPCYTCLETFWEYISEDVKELIRHEIIQVSVVLFTSTVPSTKKTPQYILQHHIGVSLAPHNAKRFDFHYAKAIEPLNYETREKMVKSIAFELGQAVVQWQHDVLKKLEQDEL